MDDDLDQAYAQAHALAGDERGPAPAVRANVLAAARESRRRRRRRAARQAARRRWCPVAPPVADVGRGRAGGRNLSSWRVRSGAAFCAVLLVGFACRRFDASRRADRQRARSAAADQALAVRRPPVPRAEACRRRAAGSPRRRPR